MYGQEPRRPVLRVRTLNNAGTHLIGFKNNIISVMLLDELVSLLFRGLVPWRGGRANSNSRGVYLTILTQKE